uniref:Ldh family oxidoreductase n=1 Tax=Brevundimonas sp. TaxID=1871086 RepID=UPI0035AFB1BA
MTLDTVQTAAAAGLGLAGLVAGALIARVRLTPGDSVDVPPRAARLAMLALSGAVLGVWSGLGHPSTAAAILTALFGWQLLLIAVVDAEHFWLPDRLTFPLAATGVVAAALVEEHRLVDAVIGAAAGFAVLWGLAVAYRRLRGREGLGGGDPFLLDMATSAVPWNKVLRYRTEAIELPEGVAVDGSGSFVTDPTRAMALAPVGGPEFGYKGAGLAGLAEVLGGILTGMRLSSDQDGLALGDTKVGHFVMAIDPTLFMTLEAFGLGVQAYIDRFKAQPGTYAAGGPEW